MGERYAAPSPTPLTSLTIRRICIAQLIEVAGPLSAPLADLYLAFRSIPPCGRLCGVQILPIRSESHFEFVHNEEHRSHSCYPGGAPRHENGFGGHHHRKSNRRKSSPSEIRRSPVCDSRYCRCRLVQTRGLTIFRSPSSIFSIKSSEPKSLRRAPSWRTSFTPRKWDHWRPPDTWT